MNTTEFKILKLSELERPLLEKFHKTYKSQMKMPADTHLWALYKGKDIIGSVCITPTETLAHWLNALYIAPDFRNQGLASMLLNKVLSNYIHDVWLFCLPELIPFYDKNGFLRCEFGLPESLEDKLTRYQLTKPLISMLHAHSL
ncbi:GNAT family N-acetyltransferase [Pseudomonas sp. F1_0610]|uniref:GNAT family N-acetyltransferase n=1 Tax=Pseudomonas sp. F1_0610 TaxID=3114284 RepID=UPI0039C2FA67